MKQFWQHLFIPRESNNHRARLLHHKVLFVLTLIFFSAGLILPAFHSARPDILGVATNISLDRLLELTNEQRVSNGLSPLSLNSQLMQAANGKASDMFAKNYWAHFAPDGATPWGFIRGAGYQYVYAGENLARGYSNADEVVSAWMTSPGHRENILSPNYKEVGFAMQSGKLTDEETTVVVQMFGSRGDEVEKPAQAAAVTPTATPTPIIAVKNTVKAILPTATSIPLPTPTVIIQATAAPTAYPQVAALHNEPLVNTKPVVRNLTESLIVLFLLVLVLDVLIIKRKQVVRVVSHNLDHIIYFTILLLAIMVMMRGSVL